MAVENMPSPPQKSPRIGWSETQGAMGLRLKQYRELGKVMQAELSIWRAQRS